MEHTFIDLLFCSLFITPLLVSGMYTVSQPGMILHAIRKLAERLGYWGNPIALCPVCMAGSAYNVFTVLALVLLLKIPLSWTILAVIALNGLVSAYTVQIATEIVELLRANVDRLIDAAADRQADKERDRCRQDPNCTCMDCPEYNERNTVKGTPYEAPSSPPQVID